MMVLKEANVTVPNTITFCRFFSHGLACSYDIAMGVVALRG